MRRFLLAAVFLGLTGPRVVGAQTQDASSLRFARSVLTSGAAQVLTVTVRDLNGKPIAGALAVATVSYGSVVHRYHLRKTDAGGTSTVSFHVPPEVKQATATVDVSVSGSSLSIALHGTFLVGKAPSKPSPVPTVVPTGQPTLTPVPAPTTAVALVTRVLPTAVTSPDPAWVVVYVHTANGQSVVGTQVVLSAAFQEGPAQLSGITDADGVATIRLDTLQARSNQLVQITAATVWHGVVASGQAALTVYRPIPTSIPTAIATSTPTSTPVPAPTWTPLPSSTPVPTPTSTSTPTLTPTLTATPKPTATSTPLPQCPGIESECQKAVLNLINESRRVAGASPLRLDTQQSSGTSTCPGSVGHSRAMAESGTIWHQNGAYPAASFPASVCEGYSIAGENVGQFATGNELTDLNAMHSAFMNEPHDAVTCGPGEINHACNIISKRFDRIGIGIYAVGGKTYVTEDFMGG